MKKNGMMSKTCWLAGGLLGFFCAAFSPSVHAQTAPDVTMTISAADRGATISDYQYGLFFEEINHAGDGGLYAELIRNRSFEDNAESPEMWQAKGGASLQLTTANPLNDAQTRSLLVSIGSVSASSRAGVVNNGFWGMNFVKGDTYELTFFMRQQSGDFGSKLVAQLLSSDGASVCGEAVVEGTPATGQWVKMRASIVAQASDPKGKFALLSEAAGVMQLDVVSLFPPTWKGRKNGLRADLAELLAGTHPSFLRFPGGCYVEGEGNYEDAFQWKKTLGPIEERPGHWNNNWKYRSSDGLGYDEYLQLCEDIGAAPMFVVNIGLGHGYVIPLQNMEPLVQDALDAIEYANGDASTEWGAKRIANGHAAPYNLKFIEIGNENYQANSGEQSQDYAERYNLFNTAIKAKYPDIITIGNVEAWGTDSPTWRNDYPVELVDEHYYRSYIWMRENYRKYDNYSREIGVYNGEYAANSGAYGKYGNMNSALGEAVYMLGLERNSDVCRMASFAPIFTHESDPYWAYDMIHFNASSVFCTPSYYVQQLLPQYLGKQNLTWRETGNELGNATTAAIGVGSWSTLVSYDDVRVTDAQGAPLIEDTFAGTLTDWSLGSGTWGIASGVLSQTLQAENCTAIHKTKLDAKRYTYHLRARKDGGNEGFLIIFNYRDDNNYVWWNLGGWNNTKHGVEQCIDGQKTTLAEAKGTIANGQWYDIDIDVDGTQVVCKLDGAVIHQFTISEQQRLYQSVQLDEEGGKLFVKVVNPRSESVTLGLNLKKMQATGGKLVRLSADSGETENDMDHPRAVFPSSEVTIGSDLSNLTIPAYSLSIFVLDVTLGSGVDDRLSYEEEDADKYGYLYAHMHSGREITCYALSTDGETFNDILDSESVVDNSRYTVTGGMRDAYVCRTENGRFMLAGTDMTSALGWESNHIMTFLLSNDLVHWDKYLSVDLKSAENLAALGVSADAITAAWAPQIIYDPVTQKYMAYYAVGFKGDRHRIYYSLMNEDLTGFTAPKLLFDPGTDVIDADIVYNAVDQQYVMIYKGERADDKCLYQATAPYLVPTTLTEGNCQWTLVNGFKVAESGAIEGCSTFRPTGSDTWKLAYMQYSGGYAFKMRDLDRHCLNPSAQGTVIKGDLAAQHGSFLKLTEREYQHLLNYEQVTTLLKKARLSTAPSEALTEAIALGEKALAESGSFTEEYNAMQIAATKLKAASSNAKEELIRAALEGRVSDLTALLENPTFAEGSKGWKGSSFSDVNHDEAEQFNTTFDSYQILTGLPNGDYLVACQGFYREGGDGIEPAETLKKANGEHFYAQLYANGESVGLCSIFESAGLTANGISSSYGTVPNSMEQAATFFAAGGYENTLRVQVTDGTLRIGIRKTTAVSRDWTIFDNFRLTYLGNPNAPDVKAAEGTFYLLNVASGLYLTAGNTYGTRASLDSRGLDLQLRATDGGAYTIDTRVSNGTKSQFLGYVDNTYYCDRPEEGWTFVARSDKSYALTHDGSHYLASDGTTILTSATDATASSAAWLLETAEEHVATLRKALETASEQRPADATFLVAAPNFSRNDLRNQQWEGAPVVGGLDDNCCAEIYNNTFDVYQTLTDVPNGWYRVEAQGFYREGGDGIASANALKANNGEHLYAQLYANGEKVALQSIFQSAGLSDGTASDFGVVPNTMGQASAFFTAGGYENSLWVQVTDGTLRLGVRKTTAVSRDWTIFDNFRLTYYGAEVKDPTAVDAISTPPTDSDAYYTLSGIRISPAKARQQRGVYVKGGKKIVIL